MRKCLRTWGWRLAALPATALLVYAIYYCISDFFPQTVFSHRINQEYSIKILSEYRLGHGPCLYFQVTRDGRPIAGRYFIMRRVRSSLRDLRFTAIPADGGSVVAVVEASDPFRVHCLFGVETGMRFPSEGDADYQDYQLLIEKFRKNINDERYE